MLRQCRSSQDHSTARPSLDGRACCGLEKNGMVGAWHGHGMASVNQTRPHCVNQMGKTYSKPLAARHGRGMAWERHAICESAFSQLHAQASLLSSILLPFLPKKNHSADLEDFKRETSLSELCIERYLPDGLAFGVV